MSASLVDAHCHLLADELAPCLDSVLEEARAAGVAAFVNATVEPAQWRPAAELSKRQRGVFHGWGIHPWFVTPESEEAIPQLARAREFDAVAIGEIGLDKKIDDPPFELQEAMFRAQLKAARELALPVVIHCRSAFNELVAILRETGPLEAGGMVHAFSGSAEIVDQLEGANLSYSMGRSLCYRKSKKRMAILERIYPDQFLLETDSPDMPPPQLEAGPNVPANIRYALRGASEMLGLEEDEIAAVTTGNARRLFGIKP